MADFLAVHVNAGNDLSGNPRRGTMIESLGGGFTEFIVHGYRGERQALRESGYSILLVGTSLNSNHVFIPDGETEPRLIVHETHLDIPIKQYNYLKSQKPVRW